MRALTARLADGDDLATALRLVAAPAVFTAAAVRAAKGEEPVLPDPSLSHAADILRMLRGAPARAAEVAALDTYLVTVCDHGLNASTFAARVVASTLAGLTSAVLAGISALKGPLHGGAPGPVIEMLDAIGGSQNARPWLEAALDRGDRLMGFGHRIYRVRDPRADALKRAVKALLAEFDAPPGRLELAEAFAGHQCRTLHGSPARGPGLSAGGLHRRLRHGPRGGLDRPCPRTGRQRPSDPPGLDLYRSVSARGGVTP
jgi:citrate synthase